jgi:hypothetical protein
MTRIAICLTCIMLLAGCGLAETAATGAAGANADIEAAKQAKQTEEQIQQQMAAAQRAADEHREAAMKAAGQ